MSTHFIAFPLNLKIDFFHYYNAFIYITLSKYASVIKDMMKKSYF